VRASQKERVPSGTISSGVGFDAEPGDLSQRPDLPDETLLLSTLRDLVAAGEHRLDPLLAAIADAALLLTSASGVALAMWKDGVMVCRARGGETAPRLGAQLSADTGISGECLRSAKAQHCVDTESDPLVDVEVCRSLGLRSIAVLPIQGKRGVNGILEAFSTTPAAFTEHHLVILEQLASLAERARSSQPTGATPARAVAPLQRQKPPVPFPVAEPVTEVVVLDLPGWQSRRVLLAVAGLAALALLALGLWLGLRRYRQSAVNPPAAAPVPTGDASSPSAVPLPDANPQNSSQADRHLPDNDPVWKPNPGGQSLTLSSAKPSAGLPSKPAVKVDAKTGKKTAADSSQLAADTVVSLRSQAPGSNARAEKSDEPAPAGSSIVTRQDGSALTGVLSPTAVLPGLSRPVSQGVSGGKLIYHIAPIYPAEAKMLRVEGKVTFDATVMEDGSLRDLKLVQGHPVLAQSAEEAVEQWRYQPFMLDGKPMKTTTRITVEFRLPRGR
jgi:TonB family protein